MSINPKCYGIVFASIETLSTGLHLCNSAWDVINFADMCGFKHDDGLVEHVMDMSAQSSLRVTLDRVYQSWFVIRIR